MLDLQYPVFHAVPSCKRLNKNKRNSLQQRLLIVRMKLNSSEEFLWAIEARRGLFVACMMKFSAGLNVMDLVLGCSPRHTSTYPTIYVGSLPREINSKRCRNSWLWRVGLIAITGCGATLGTLRGAQQTPGLIDPYWWRGGSVMEDRASRSVCTVHGAKEGTHNTRLALLDTNCVFRQYLSLPAWLCAPSTWPVWPVHKDREICVFITFKLSIPMM